MWFAEGRQAQRRHGGISQDSEPLHVPKKPSRNPSNDELLMDQQQILNNEYRAWAEDCRTCHCPSPCPAGFFFGKQHCRLCSGELRGQRNVHSVNVEARAK